MYSYSISVSQNIRMMSLLAVKYAILYILYSYFGRQLPASVIYIVLVAVFLIDILPTVLLHANYLYFNWQGSVTFNLETGEMLYKKNSKTLRFLLSEVKAMDYYSCYGKGSGFYSFENYRYMKLTLQGGQVIVISCLIMRKIEEEMPKLIPVPFEKNLRVLPFIWSAASVDRS